MAGDGRPLPSLREPGDADDLRHDQSWWECVDCSKPVAQDRDSAWTLARTDRFTFCRHGRVELRVEPAASGQVPQLVRAWCQAGKPGWLRHVATGRGCPHCYGKPVTEVPEPSWADLDDLDTATEGEFTGWL